MGTLYTTKTISGYNQSPPPNDGTQVASNQVTWDKHKDKLTDPIKTLAEAINTALVNHVDITPVEKASGYTTVADDYGRTIIYNQSVVSPTFSLLALASCPDGYHVRFHSKYVLSNTDVTISVDGGGTLHHSGAANNTVTLEPGESIHVQISDDKSYYMVLSEQGTLTYA